MMRSVVISMRLPPNAAYCAAWNSSFLTTFGRLSGSREPTSRDGAGHDARAKIVPVVIPVVIPVFDPAIVAPGGPIGIMACSYGIFAHIMYGRLERHPALSCTDGYGYRRRPKAEG